MQVQVQEELAADPRSARVARALTGDTLEAWGLLELVETAALLVSELVTNALLHAGSPLRLRMERLPSAVRVTVQDANETLPALHRHDPDAVTGRGLELVSLLADRTGSHRAADSGKIVWFELEAPHDPSLADSASGIPIGEDYYAAPSEPQGAQTAVTLLDVPWRLLTAMRQHTDALLRELAMMDLADGILGDVPFGSLAAALGLSEDLAEGRPDDAIAADEPYEAREDAAVAVTVTADSDSVERLADRLHRADILARGDATLVPPALPEIAACRQWFLTELSNQIAGHGPTPWTVAEAARADPLEQADVPAVAPEAVLDGMAEAVLLADSDNRIRYANPAVERLLGWKPEQLVGRRVLEIVPHRFRAAHVAGYTRFLVTGEPRLMGTPVEVPVLRRDGSEARAVMLLSLVDRPEGGTQFVATFRSLTQRLDISEGPTPDD